MGARTKKVKRDHVISRYIGQPMPIPGGKECFGFDLVSDYRDLQLEQGQVVVSGDCLVCLGTMKHFPDADLIWIDAHADSHTPETSLSGHFGGMPLSILTGRCYNAYRREIGTPKIDERQVVHMASFDSEATERLVGAYYDPSMRLERPKVIHVDLDVMKIENVDFPHRNAWHPDRLIGLLQGFTNVLACSISYYNGHYISDENEVITDEVIKTMKEIM